MNKWQQYYINKYHNGKMPRSKKGKIDMALLGKIKNQVIVAFPDNYGPDGFIAAHTETFLVTEKDCNIPGGTISVTALLNNIPHWIALECKITTK